MINQALPNFFFYFLGLFSILFALGVVLSHNILRAAVGLLVTLSLSAGFYLLLGAEFMAGIQLMVYVGGIVVLIAFAIMLTQGLEPVKKSEGKRRLIAAFSALSFFAVSSYALLKTNFPAMRPQGSLPGAKEIGLRLLDMGPEGFIIPFEVISVLLLSALIGAIVIAKKIPEAHHEENQ